MVDKQILEDMGFVLGTGWDHEVWVRDGSFWVHYGEYEPSLIGHRIISGYKTNKEFFDKFLDIITDEEY
tara:strand:+ start:149 stop:355 length:207 start_codon:yes stop_codon:yes gene_type:complete